MALSHVLLSVVRQAMCQVFMPSDTAVKHETEPCKMGRITFRVDRIASPERLRIDRKGDTINTEGPNFAALNTLLMVE